MSFLSPFSPSRIVPSGRTTSSPSTVPCKLPYRRSRRPPALVATFPPTQQDPFAPRSRGNKCPLSARYESAFSRMTPASRVSTPEWGLKLRIELSDCRDNTTSLNNGILPPMDQKSTGSKLPTNPVLPPCGTTAMFSSLQNFMMLLTCSTVLGRRTTLP